MIAWLKLNDGRSAGLARMVRDRRPWMSAKGPGGDCENKKAERQEDAKVDDRAILHVLV